jgi:hypothetical protein
MKLEVTCWMALLILVLSSVWTIWNYERQVKMEYEMGKMCMLLAAKTVNDRGMDIRLYDMESMLALADSIRGSLAK